MTVEKQWNRGIDPTIERLRTEHAQLETRLFELNKKVWLTPAEEVEKKNIQKMKLMKKDQMEILRNRISI